MLETPNLIQELNPEFQFLMMRSRMRQKKRMKILIPMIMKFKISMRTKLKKRQLNPTKKERISILITHKPTLKISSSRKQPTVFSKALNFRPVNF